MRRFIPIVFILFNSFISFAQTGEVEIDVIGYADFEKQVDTYQVEIVISPDSYYAYDGSRATSEELKKIFFDAMKEKGFEESQFKKSHQERYYANDLGQNPEAYIYETSSEEDFTRFITSKKTNGTYLSTKTVNYKPISNHEELITIAMEDARKKAQVMANALGKNLGELKSVTNEHNNFLSQQDGYRYEHQKGIYQLKVKFTVR